MRVQLANAERMAADAMAAVLQPPPPVDYLTWAEANIEFTERESQFPGPYNRILFPYFDEVLRALSPADPCRIVTLAKSAQIGGTVVANIFTLGSMAMDPGDFLYVHPTEDNARRWSKMKLAPMLRATPTLARLFPQKSRDGSDSTLYKERADGLGALQISGSNSAAALSQVSMRRQVQDDLSKWETNLGGNPESQADSRTRAFEFGKIFKVSTPLVMPGCRVTANLEAGSQEYPYVPCPHCGHRQVLEWANMQATLDATAPEQAHFTCVDAACGKPIREHDRPKMLAGLEWRAHNPAAKREHRSFWIWSAYSYLQSFERIAREWLKVKGDAEAEKTFLNDTAGLAYRARGEAPPWEGLRDRAATSPYARGTIPQGALLMTLGLDCQIDRVEWQLVGFGRDRRRWVIDHHVVPGHISRQETRERLDALMAQTWLNAAGRRIGADMAAIDGNAWTEDVWDWARRHPASRVIMVRGRGEDGVPLIMPVKKERDRRGNLLKYSRRFYNFGTSILKMALYRNLAVADLLAEGYVGLPQGLDDEFYRQLTAERREPEKRDGFVVYRWKKDPSQANEGLDTHLQAEAAAIKWGVKGLPDATWDKLEAERESPVPGRQLDLEDLMLAPGLAPLAPIAREALPAALSPRAQAEHDRAERERLLHRPAAPAPPPGPRIAALLESLMARREAAIPPTPDPATPPARGRGWNIPRRT